MTDLGSIGLEAIRFRSEGDNDGKAMMADDRRWLIRHVDRLQLDLDQTREAKAEALRVSHVCREHHRREHPDCR